MSLSSTGAEECSAIPYRDGVLSGIRMEGVIATVFVPGR
jgi:hypothetical protein